ncbi:MAG: cadmium-translocating P-type ATPase [Ruminococcaceae bacterium]|nr:cadmium-translocating P-type ATPase [Oscillospiraceae bacterium]
MKLKFEITGMTCAACAARVEKATKGIPGVSDVQVNLLSNSMTLEASDAAVSAEVISCVTAAGYGARPAGEKPKLAQTEETDHRLARLISSGCLLVVLMYFTMGHMFGLPLPAWYHGEKNAMVAALVQLLLTMPVIVLNRSYYIRGLKALWHRSPNMDTLIAVGSGAALLYGIMAVLRMAYAIGHGDWETVGFYGKNLYFESAAMILTLVSLGKYLEHRAKGKTGDAIRALMDLRPATATVLRDGEEQTIPADQVVVGDVILVRSGGRIPVDGIVLEGHAAVDQSALTGESVPVDIKAGDSVSAATINTEGFLKLRAQKVGKDTLLQQVIDLVEEAGNSKAPIARLADKVSGIFVPVVMTIAVVTFVVWMLLGHGLEFSLTCAISVLVISCPCALGLATPVAIMVGTGKGASMGVLFKNGDALEQLHRVNTIVLDKTGTLTTGKPVVTDILPEAISADGLLGLAAALEQPSEHPFAKAILKKAEGMQIKQATAFETLPGRGVSAYVDGVCYLGGNKALMEAHGICVPDHSELSEQGKTPLYFAAKDGTYLGAIAAADVLKDDAVSAVKALHELKLQVVMLTGDNEKTASAIAKKAGITEVIANVLPADKAGAVKALQEKERRVLMVGDGINDAPALVTAHVGMAIGAGTDIAMESADVVLMGDSLNAIANAIRLSKAVLRNIRQNLFWAFFYNCLGIPVAAGVLFLPFGIQLSPMIGAAAMSMSSVFVVTNALRLRRFKGSGTAPQIEKEKIEMTTVLKVEGMMCPHCKAMVEKVCKAVPGATDALVDLQAKNVTVSGNADRDALVKAITDAGYEVVG